MINELFVELIGTFIFLSVIISYGKAIPIGLTLACVVYWGGSVSGGHFNPAVTIMTLLNKKINIIKALFYIICQIIGAILALLYFHNLIGNKTLSS
jgi:aquaporin Z